MHVDFEYPFVRIVRLSNAISVILISLRMNIDNAALLVVNKSLRVNKAKWIENIRHSDTRPIEHEHTHTPHIQFLPFRLYFQTVKWKTSILGSVGKYYDTSRSSDGQLRLKAIFHCCLLLVLIYETFIHSFSSKRVSDCPISFQQCVWIWRNQNWCCCSVENVNAGRTI